MLSIYGQQNDEFIQNIECFEKIASVGLNNQSWNIDSINQINSCNTFLENREFKIKYDTLNIKSINDTTLWQKIILQSDTVAIIILKLPELTGKSERLSKKKNKLSNGNKSNLIYLRYSKDGKLKFYNNAL
jgi:hypothetical protein